MAFFVLDKDPHSGVLRLPVDGVFATREEALAALSAAVGAGTATVTGQVYVVDLETALPVLVMPTAPAPVETAAIEAPAAPAAEAEPEAEEAEPHVAWTEPEAEEAEPHVAWTEPEAAGSEPAPVDEPGPAPVDEPGPAPEDEPGPAPEDDQPEVPLDDESVRSEPVAEGVDLGVFGAAAGGVSLADALKRAATSLEDEGIVAPESISADDFALEDELVAATDDAVADAPAAVTDTARTVAEPMSALDREPAEVLTAPADWPWSNVEAFTEEVVDEDEPVAQDGDDAPSTGDLPDTTPDAIVAPLPLSGFDQGESLITSAPPVGEEAYLPRPVILGDYVDDGLTVPAEPGAVTEESAPVEPAGVEPVANDLPEPVAEDTSAANPFGAVLESLSPAPGESLPEPAVAEIGYEPTGELDLSAYTCNDCVYSNTCPKVGEVTPAECGTFQWRSS